MHDPQTIHTPTTRGHTRPAANISTPTPRACTTRSQYIYIQPAGTHHPQPIYLHPPRAHARPAVTINIYPYHPLLRRPTTAGIFLAGSARHSADPLVSCVTLHCMRPLCRVTRYTVVYLPAFQLCFTPRTRQLAIASKAHVRACVVYRLNG